MQFKGYFDKFPGGDLLSVFDDWCRSKDIWGKDKHYIWKIARHFRSSGEIEIRDKSDESVKMGEVLERMFVADFERLKKYVEKKYPHDGK